MKGLPYSYIEQNKILLLVTQTPPLVCLKVI